MAMTEEQLKKVMKKHLKNFNSNPEIKVSDNTVHNTILSANDGYGTANSKQIYKGMVRWSLSITNSPLKEWPKKWMEMSVKDLANKLMN